MPDGWYDVYRWFRALTPADTAEELTAEVCRRSGRAQPAWLANQTPDVRQRYLVIRLMLERRGVLAERCPPAAPT